jgi:hypothetical protein
VCLLLSAFSLRKLICPGGCPYKRVHLLG